MLALFGLLIVVGFMTLIMTKKATPFTSLILVPLFFEGKDEQIQINP